MNKHIKLVMFCCVILGANSTLAQTKKSNKPLEDTLRKYYTSLLNSKAESGKVLLEEKLYAHLKSEEEKDWMTAANFFYQLKKIAVSDSVVKAAKIKFPAGQYVRNDEVKVVYDETDPAKKEQKYKAWIKKFPPSKFGEERIQYDYARNAVATAYAKDENVKKALQYANMVKTPVWKGEGWAGTAGVLLKNGHLDEAAELYKKAIKNSYKYMTTNRTDVGAGFAATGYVGYNNSLAEILLKQKKYGEALGFVRAAHDSSNTVRGYINSNYAQVLIALGKHPEAFDKINEAVAAGQATTEMKETLKTLYVKVKGSTEGYDAYVASLNKILADKIRKDMAKQMIKMPAPGFMLKDVDGNVVSLASLKGKTVLLDFWATWCGPCKKSFPAMKMAVDKFKDDSNVKFLFIHTWEHGDSIATQNAKKFVVENNYPFEVLMDLQDGKTGLNKAVEDYKISSIPTKFVIDKEGNIRFRFSGFSGGDDAAVEEVAAMIELAQKG